MASLLFIHLLFVGLWLGCVLTEALFERALLDNGNEARLILANLHARVDTFIEIGAFDKVDQLQHKMGAIVLLGMLFSIILAVAA